jgi:hypothetical protein
MVGYWAETRIQESQIKKAMRSGALCFFSGINVNRGIHFQVVSVLTLQLVCVSVCDVKKNITLLLEVCSETVVFNKPGPELQKMITE